MNQFTSKASGPFDTPEAMNQALRERTRLAMVEQLRKHGEPLTCTQLSNLTGYTVNAIGRVAFEARRTFETDLALAPKRSRSGAPTTVQIYLHPHLKGHP